MVLSPKTNDHDLSAILRKLEVSTPAKAVPEASRLGIIEGYVLVPDVVPAAAP